MTNHTNVRLRPRYLRHTLKASSFIIIISNSFILLTWHLLALFIMVRGINILSLGKRSSHTSSTWQIAVPKSIKLTAKRWWWDSWCISPVDLRSNHGESPRLERFRADTSTLRLFRSDWRHEYRRVYTEMAEGFGMKFTYIYMFRIIAIMLGRLGMSVHECLNAYKKMAQKAFTPKHRIHLPAVPSGAFSATALEGAIKAVIKEQCPEEQCKTNGCHHDDKVFRDRACCKT